MAYSGREHLIRPGARANLATLHDPEASALTLSVSARPNTGAWTQQPNLVALVEFGRDAVRHAVAVDVLMGLLLTVPGDAASVTILHQGTQDEVWAQASITRALRPAAVTPTLTVYPAPLTLATDARVIPVPAFAARARIERATPTPLRAAMVAPGNVELVAQDLGLDPAVLPVVQGATALRLSSLVVDDDVLEDVMAPVVVWELCL